MNEILWNLICDSCVQPLAGAFRFFFISIKIIRRLTHFSVTLVFAWWIRLYIDKFVIQMKIFIRIISYIVRRKYYAAMSQINTNIHWPEEGSTKRTASRHGFKIANVYGMTRGHATRFWDTCIDLLKIYNVH